MWMNAMSGFVEKAEVVARTKAVIQETVEQELPKVLFRCLPSQLTDYFQRHPKITARLLTDQLKDPAIQRLIRVALDPPQRKKRS